MRLLIADDHTLFRDALVQYIERGQPDAEVLLAKDFYEARDILETDPVMDLVILDLRMPGMKGFEGLKFVRDVYPDTPVAMISGVAEPEDVKKAVELGAKGYFPKTLSGKALLKAIMQVIEGENFIPLDDNKVSYMPSYYADDKAQNTSQAEQTSETVVAKDIAFTPREAEVLSFLARGDSNKEIANELGLQIVTVKLHVSSICRKMGVKNRTQAALMSRDLGISEPKSNKNS